MHHMDLMLTLTGGLTAALAMTAAILSTLGATPEQIDRERARVHADLSGSLRGADQQHNTSVQPT